MKEQLDFLALGDITTDTFIRLKDADVTCDINDEHCTISMRWGDKIPYEFAIEVIGVGNAANAAVSAARLGLTSALFTYTGTDENGAGDIKNLQDNGVDTSFVSQSADLPSNHDFVLWYGNERSILVKHSIFPYEFPADLAPPRYLYLSSLGDPTGKTHAAIAAWAKAHPETKMFFQPGQEVHMKKELLKEVYEAAYFCVCNKEEAAEILGHQEIPEMSELLKEMTALGPQIVVITDGLNGASAYDGTNQYSVPLYPDDRAPYERTGAGDAFASTIACALALGKPLEEALMWGPINSMSVVQDVGAQKGLMTRVQIEEHLANAPADYTLTTL